MDYQVKIVEKVFPEIYIVDPSDSIIMQWINLPTKRGLIELNLPLADEPNLGTWNIKLKENEYEKTFLSTLFEVKKYVLPKFQVTLDHFEKISIEDKSFNVTVCAKYLFR